MTKEYITLNAKRILKAVSVSGFTLYRAAKYLASESCVLCWDDETAEMVWNELLILKYETVLC